MVHHLGVISGACLPACLPVCLPDCQRKLSLKPFNLPNPLVCTHRQPQAPLLVLIGVACGVLQRFRCPSRAIVMIIWARHSTAARRRTHAAANSTRALACLCSQPTPSRRPYVPGGGATSAARRSSWMDSGPPVAASPSRRSVHIKWLNTLVSNSTCARSEGAARLSSSSMQCAR